MELKLRILEGTNTGRDVPVVGPKFFIGRAEDCQLRPHSDLISRHHCVISVEGDYVNVRDFGSKNGTYVNGTRVIGQRELKAGDRLKVGPLHFEVVISTSVGGPKRAAVKNVQEAVARATEVASSGTTFSLDDWMKDEGAPPQDAALNETRTLSLQETTHIPPQPPAKDQKANAPDAKSGDPQAEDQATPSSKDDTAIQPRAELASQVPPPPHTAASSEAPESSENIAASSAAPQQPTSISDQPAGQDQTPPPGEWPPQGPYGAPPYPQQGAYPQQGGFPQQQQPGYPPQYAAYPPYGGYQPYYPPPGYAPPYQGQGPQDPNAAYPGYPPGSMPGQPYGQMPPGAAPYPYPYGPHAGAYPPGYPGAPPNPDDASGTPIAPHPPAAMGASPAAPADVESPNTPPQTPPAATAAPVPVSDPPAVEEEKEPEPPAPDPRRYVPDYSTEEGEAKDKADKKDKEGAAGKLPSKQTGTDSREAAADTLRKLFRRR